MVERAYYQGADVRPRIWAAAQAVKPDPFASQSYKLCGAPDHFVDANNMVAAHDEPSVATWIMRSKCAATLAAKSSCISYTSVNSANAHRPCVLRLLTPGIQ